MKVETVTVSVSALARMARRAAERGVRGVGGGESNACGAMMQEDRSIAAWRSVARSRVRGARSSKIHDVRISRGRHRQLNAGIEVSREMTREGGEGGEKNLDYN